MVKNREFYKLTAEMLKCYCINHHVEFKIESTNEHIFIRSISKCYSLHNIKELCDFFEYHKLNYYIEVNEEGKPQMVAF